MICVTFFDLDTQWAGDIHTDKKNPKLSRRLDHFLITESLQQSVDKVTILPTIEKCDHSPILLQINFLNENDNGKGYWKFNNSLLQNNDFCLKIEQKIESVIN